MAYTESLKQISNIFVENNGDSSNKLFERFHLLFGKKTKLAIIVHTGCNPRTDGRTEVSEKPTLG